MGSSSLSATAKDADNDVLTVTVTVTAAPEGSDYALAEDGSGGYTFVAQDVGLYSFELIVSDGELQASSSIDLTVLPSNSPPILGNLRDTYTVELGLEFALDINAVDPDGDAVTYFVSTLPLPMGAKFDAQIGEMRFRPEIGQEGTYLVTIGASDGIASATHDFSLEVVAGTASDTSVYGRVLDAAAFAAGVETPLAGIPVTLRDAALATTTLADGSFSFGSLTGGADLIFVEPSSTGGPSGYLSTSRSITITEQQNRDLSPDFLLAALNEGCAEVVAGVETVLTGAETGIVVSIAADTILDGAGAAYVGEVCLGSFPRQSELVGLPSDTVACYGYGISAIDAVFTSGAQITVPNVDNLPEASELELWQRQTSGSFRRVSKGIVDSGAVTVSSTLSSITSGSQFTMLPQQPDLSRADDQPTGNRVLSVFDGDLNETYTLPGYTAFNQTQQVGLSYHSTAADPTVIVAANTKILATASLPVSLETGLEIGGLTYTAPQTWNPRLAADGTTPALLGEQVDMRQSFPFDASGLPTAIYDATFIAKAKYDCSIVADSNVSEIYVQNETESVYGTGWSIDDLQKVVTNPDGTVSVIDDDQVATFKPEPTFTNFEAETLYFPTNGTVDLKTGDFDGNGHIDFVYSEGGYGRLNVVLNYGDRQFETVEGPQIATPKEVPSAGIYYPSITSLETLDFDYDGLLDVIYTDQDVDLTVPMVGQGNGSFVSGLAIPGRSTTVAIADFDGDGFIDFVVPSGSYSSWGLGILAPKYYYGNGTDYDIITYNLFSGQSLDSAVNQTIVADMDADGLLDMVYRNDEGVSITYNKGTRGLGVLKQFQMGTSPRRTLGNYAAVADINNDGLPDVITSGNDLLEVYLNIGDRTFATGVELVRPVGATSAGQINLIDVNADGELDLMYSGLADSVEGPIAIYSGNGDGTFGPPEFGLIDHGVGTTAVVDIDSDGSLDLLSTQRFFVAIDFSDPTASGKLVAGAGEFSELIALDGGGWERRYKDGAVVAFNSDGLQTAKVDTYGNRIEYAYGADGRLASISDQNGDETIFAYTAEGRLDTITYPDGRQTIFTYDDAQLATITEPAGGMISYRYDENNRLVAVTNQNGNATNYSYDATGKFSGAELADGSSISNQVASSLGLVGGLGNELPLPLAFVAPEDRVTTVTDRKGEQTEIIVNQFGAVVQITDPLGRITKMDRNDNNLVIKVERPASDGSIRVDTIAYDDQANVAEMTEAFGTASARTTFYTYEPTFNKVTSMTDADGFQTAYEYDAYGSATRTIDPEGGEQTFAYTPEGKLLSQTDKNGNATAYAYNAAKNLSQITYADGSVSQMTYDARGNTTAMAEASGTDIERSIQRTYDALNRVLTVEVTGADGAQIDGLTTYAYAPAGNLTSVTDETGLVTSMTYDTLERLVSVNDPAEGMIQRVYNAAGEVTQHINGAGETHNYSYDGVSRLIGTVDPAGYAKEFGYDLRDNIASVTDGRGGQTGFTFDALDRMITRTNPLGETMVRGYDGRDNLTTLTREDGLVETAGYDGLGRRTSVGTPDNALTYAYDAQGNLSEAADNDSRVTFTYDLRNRLVSTTTDGTVGPQPQVTISYTYDALDRRTSMSDSLGGTTTYAYDVEDRLTDLTAPWGTVYNFGYDGEGRRTSLTSTSGRNTAYGYTNGLLTSLSHVQSGVALTDLAYAYDVDAQLTAIKDNLDPTKSLSIAYDDLNRLLQVAEGIPVIDGGVPIPVEDYAYDEEGNRLASHLSNLYASNAHNQLEEDDTFTYAYDTRGNRISRTAKADGAVETYSYDSQNRLIGYASDTTTASYAYDAMERRIAKTVDGAVTAYVYDQLSPSNVKNEIVLDFENSDLARRWLYGNRVDEPLEFEKYEGTTAPNSGYINTLLSDRLGSIEKVLTQASGVIEAELEYSSFGERTMTAGQASGVVRYGYTGREHDDESGLIYYRARHYDPTTGRFMQPDPIDFHAGDLNIYAYVENDPINFVDPSGLFLNSVEQARLTHQAAGTAVIVAQKSAIGVTQLAAMLGWQLWYFCEVYTGSPGCFDKTAEEALETQTDTGQPGGGPNPPTVKKPGHCGGVSVHGNSRSSDLYTVLYALYDSDGMFLKYGVTAMDPPSSRYSVGLSRGMIILAGGCRSDMLDKERKLTSSNGGPWNFEPWSSSRGQR